MLSVNPSSLLQSVLRYLAAQSHVEDGTGIRIAEAMLNGVLRIELASHSDAWSVGFGWSLISTDLHTWLADLRMYVIEGAEAIGYRDRFFRKIAIPLLEADQLLKDQQNPNRKQAALAKLSRLPVHEWVLAMTQFINQQPENVNEPARSRRT
jgi:hypothetical protein